MTPPPRPDPPALHVHAMDNLRYIRETMERAGAFTAVPGWGGVLMGVSAIITTPIAGKPDNSTRWLATWLVEAAIAATIALVAMARKSRRLGSPLFAAPGQRFALAFLPPLAAGAVLTAVLAKNGLADRLPGCWLLLYGAGMTTGGAFSVRVVPVMGLSLMAAGIVALLAPQEWGHLFMAAGFGALQIGFGIVIARRHGG